MNNAQLKPSSSRPKIATLVDHQRDGRFVFAFCPICDHAEEAEAHADGRHRAESVSIDKIKIHIRSRHRAKLAEMAVFEATS